MAVRVKICGLTRSADAEIAVRNGASFLGAVFAESPRQVSALQARELAQAGGTVPLLGVFTDASVDEILRLRDRAGLAGAQLHGEYSPESRTRLKHEGLLVWSVARLANVADVDRLADLEVDADAVLVEPLVEGVQGGSGEALTGEVARAARARIAKGSMVLAGGLTPETVAAAIALVRPDIVDVSSGVEAVRGRKDPARLVRFMEVVGDADPGA